MREKAFFVVAGAYTSAYLVILLVKGWLIVGLTSYGHGTLVYSFNGQTDKRRSM